MLLLGGDNLIRPTAPTPAIDRVVQRAEQVVLAFLALRCYLQSALLAVPRIRWLSTISVRSATGIGVGVVAGEVLGIRDDVGGMEGIRTRLFAGLVVVGVLYRKF